MAPAILALLFRVQQCQSKPCTSRDAGFTDFRFFCIAPGLQSQGSPLEDPLCLAEEKLPEGCLHFALLPSVSDKDARFKILQSVY